MSKLLSQSHVLFVTWVWVEWSKAKVFCTLVKKGQNNKIINLHDKTAIYTSRFVYIHQDSYIYIKIRIHTARSVYIHQDSYIYIKIRIHTLRFVQFRHKGKHDRWIDYRVFKRRPKNGSKWGSHFLRSPPCFAVFTEPWQKKWLQLAMLKKSCREFFLPVLVHSSLLCAIHEWIMQAMVVVERKGD